MKNIQFELINPLEHQERVLELLKQLNPELDMKRIKNALIEMVETPHYRCFGLFFKRELIGISSGWITNRIYCGKQLELDNVIIDSKIQSKGYGKFFLNAIKEWSTSNNYKAIGLNSYVQNSRSHKFYLNEGYRILGFHFEKVLHQENG